MSPSDHATQILTSQVLLYDHPVSSYAQKIRIALREKDVSFTSKVPDTLLLGKAEPQFESTNPRLEVPTLIDASGGSSGGDEVVRLFDSTVILEYIEDRWPEPALLPPRQKAAARAKARTIEEICDTQYEAVNWGWGEIVWFKRAGEGDDKGGLAEKMKAEVVRQTAVLQAWLTRQLGEHDFFGGDTFGWGDICAAAVVNRSRSYGLGPADDTPLGRWLNRISQRPSVSETFAEFAAAAPKMAGLAELFRSGQRRREYRDHRLEWMVKSGGIDIVREGLDRNNIRFSWP